MGKEQARPRSTASPGLAKGPGPARLDEEANEGRRPRASGEGIDPDEEEGDRPRSTKKKKRKKESKKSKALLYSLAGGGVALTAIAVVLVVLLNRGNNHTNSAGAQPPFAPPGGPGRPSAPGVPGPGGPFPPNGGRPAAGPVAFLDQAKMVPAGLEWSREVTSRRGGTITFRVTSQGPFAVTVVTDRAFKSLQSKNAAPLDKQDVLFTLDSKEAQLERSVTLPPGSSWFIIENHAPQAAQIRLECFAKE